MGKEPCEEQLPLCASVLASLSARLTAVEQNCAKKEKRIDALEASVDALNAIKQTVIGWGIAAGSIATFIWTQLATIKDLLH